MAQQNGTIHPTVLWAQRKEFLLITIQVEDIEKPVTKLDANKLYFTCVGGHEKKTYEVELEFNKAVDPKESHYDAKPSQREFRLKIQKAKASEGFWPRLLKDTTKRHWLKTDFERWKDEDDSDVEEENPMAFQDMMSQMASFNEQNEEPVDNEEDSDDEELPDLE